MKFVSTSSKKLARLRLKLISYFKKNTRFSIFIFVTIFIAVFFRFYDYLTRIYIYADSSLFVQVAYFAYKNFKLPQIGPFAQGPFFTGPWWLWILQTVFIVPLGLLTPWYFMSLLSLIFIILIFFAGKEIGGREMGALAALFASLSTAQIDNSFTTWNAAADPFLGLLVILWVLKYRKERKSIYFFLAGFCLSLAISIHFQSAFIAPLVGIAIVTLKPKIKDVLALVIGISIPLLPFLYFDIRFHWFETRRILDYLLIGQQRIYIPNRWLTYAGVYWPTNWAWIIGGNIWVVYLLIGFTTILSIVRLIQYKKYVNYYIVAFSFVLSLVMLRYYRGERQFYYTNYAHAFVLLITAWTIKELYAYKKILGAGFAGIIIVFSFQASLRNFAPRVITYQQVNQLVSEVYTKYPQANFDIYECPFVASMISTAVSYKIYYDGRNTPDGIKIGVCNDNFKLSWREVTDREIDFQYGYKNKSTPHTYEDMTEWWKKNPPGASLY